MKESRLMKPEPQNAAPAISATAGSQLEGETRNDSNPREPGKLPTKTPGDRDGWRAYFPAAVRKTLKRRDEENRSRETCEKLQARFEKTLVVLMFTFFCLAATARANACIAVRPVQLKIAPASFF
jgi:hypothetical protein